jgi:hypothetical protein
MSASSFASSAGSLIASIARLTARRWSVSNLAADVYSSARARRGIKDRILLRRASVALSIASPMTCK